MKHVADIHDDFDDPLFLKCAHEDMEPRKWIYIGTRAYDPLNLIITNKAMVTAVAKLSSGAQTSYLEGFHSTLNNLLPKQNHYSCMGTECRTAIAVIHFDENSNWESQKSLDGKTYYKVTYPTFKNGEAVVRQICVPQTYEYVKDIKVLLKRSTRQELENVLTAKKKDEPEPLSRKFKERRTKEAARAHQAKKNRMEISFFPPEQEQVSLLKQQLQKEEKEKAKKHQRTCRKCQQPMKGHAKSKCQDK